MFFNGMPVYELDSMVDTHTEIARKHRQKRIQKKWIKRYGYKIVSVPKKVFYIFDGRIVCHPELFKKLKEVMDNQRT